MGKRCFCASSEVPKRLDRECLLPHCINTNKHAAKSTVHTHNNNNNNNNNKHKRENAMGCTSSTEVVTDPYTGQEKEKKKWGGAYPGNRPPQHAPYTPDANQFNPVTNQATSHFVSYGGGNALVLTNGPKPNSSGGDSGGKPQFVQVTIPAGVNAGDTIHVQAPDGRLNEIVVPPGMGPGSSFAVQFEDAPTTTTTIPTYTNPPIATSTTASPETFRIPQQSNNNNNQEDDGFASGFNNPYHTTSTTNNNYNNYNNNYTPTFSAPPSYPPPPKY